MQTLLRTGPAEHAPDGGRAGSAPGGVVRRWLSSGAATTFVVVAGVTAFVIAQLRPDLLLGPNMDVGGDNAAHVVAVHYFLRHVLPTGSLSGWDPQWFGGFPLYVFYFPFPALLVGAVNLVTPYAVAFKVVSVLGVALMPVSAFVFGRLAGFRRPVPALMSAAMVPFLFNTSYTIDGGNIVSTLAGEFSFTLALALALCFLGVVAHSLRTGRLRWLAAALFCMTLLSHVVPALFAAAGAVLLGLVRPDRRRADRLLGRLSRLGRAYRRPITVVASIGIVGALLAAVWLVPFAAYLRYSSSMNYGRVGGFQSSFFPASAEVTVQALAILGTLFALVRRHRVALVLAVLAGGSVAAFFLLPSGLVYNARWLPFWFVTTALLAAYGVSEAVALLLRLAPPTIAGVHRQVTGLLGGVVAVGLTASFLGVLPVGNVPIASRSFVPDWVSWNYTGYQGKPGWPEFRQLVAMLQRVAAVHGCGRLDFEYSPNTTNAYGSTLVPMSFPLWTHGCIGSEEGVYYESSTATPFHFLDQAELSLAPSNPVVGLPYEGLDVADGIRHLQLSGVKYFLASSPTVEEQAAADPSLVEVGSSPESASVVDRPPGTPAPPSGSTFHYVLYELRGSPLVVPLRHQPVVEAGQSKNAWLATAIAWYQDEADWSVPLTTAGPASWRRGRPGQLVAPATERRLPADAVRRVRMTADTVSFDVARTGVPVLVKVPYFPNWKATGALGPYLATPDLMVVVPTSRTVVLHYGTTAVDWAGEAGSLAGVAGLVALVHSGGAAPTEPAAAGSLLLDGTAPDPWPTFGPPLPPWRAGPPGAATDEDDDGLAAGQDGVDEVADQPRLGRAVADGEAAGDDGAGGDDGRGDDGWGDGDGRGDG